MYDNLLGSKQKTFCWVAKIQYLKANIFIYSIQICSKTTDRKGFVKFRSLTTIPYYKEIIVF